MFTNLLARQLRCCLIIFLFISGAQAQNSATGGRAERLTRPAFSQSQAATGIIRGTVTLQPAGLKVRNAIVTIAELKKSVLTDQDGVFEFQDIPAGMYQIIAHLDRVPDVV